MISLIWEKLPGYIKWPLLISAFAFILPVRLYEGAKSFIHTEVNAVVVPIEEKRDIQMTVLRDDIATIKQDTRDIKNHLMKGQK